VPKIIKICQSFLKLQLIMSGSLFETQCRGCGSGGARILEQVHEGPAAGHKAVWLLW